jgi:hypothetical protein
VRHGGSDEDRGRCRRPSIEDRTCQVLSGQMIGRSGVTPTFYKNKVFANIELHIGCISICRAYKNPSKNLNILGIRMEASVLLF